MVLNLVRSEVKHSTKGQGSISLTFNIPVNQELIDKHVRIKRASTGEEVNVGYFMMREAKSIQFGTSSEFPFQDYLIEIIDDQGKVLQAVSNTHALI